MRVPPLREELALTEGPRAHDGQPSWTLHDPARNRFFRLDWLTFEMLQRWSLGEPELILRQVADQTPLKPSEADLEAVLKFVAGNQLLKLAGANNSAAFARQHAQSRPGAARWLVHNYLFFRVPLVRPEKFLAGLAQRLRFIFAPLFWRVTLAALCAGAVLVWRQWHEFTATWSELANFHGLLGYLAVIVAVKIVHELGHGLTATHFGCRVPSMGVAFLVLTPVAYTDVNEAWKLTERRPRLWIGAAGVLAELWLAAWATLAWGLLPDGYLRSVAFIVATTTWVKSLLINTSPVMRFDGYYLLSDYLDLPNLHHRSFALARWKLREWLFGLREAPPEYFRRSLARGLIALAMFIWIYRLVVFLGIAVFVYYFFFKALGIVLFAVEIAWFVLLPIASELKAWLQRRRAIAGSSRARGLAVAGAAALVLACVPLPQRIKLAGEFSPQQEFKIVAPENSRLVDLNLRDGATVKPGERLLQLASDLLKHRLENARARERTLEAQIASASADPLMRGKLPTMQAALGTTQAVRREAETALAKLTPAAPFAGVLRMTDCEVKAGDWIARDEHIATLVGDGAWQVVGYLPEQHTHLVAAGVTARFYPEGAPDRPIELELKSVDRDASRTLSHGMLTTPFGGDLPARLVENELVPEHAVYRVRLAALAAPPELANRIRRGQVVLSAGSESLAARFGRRLLSLVGREAGF